MRKGGQEICGTHLNKVANDNVAVRLQDCESDEEHEVVRVVIRPQYFPKAKNIVEWEFTLERNEDPAETSLGH